MSGSRPPWFEYYRPHPGKIRMRPIAPAGWATLLAVPLPALAIAVLARDLLGRGGAAIAALAIGGLTMLGFFRLAARRGVRRD